MLSVAVLLLAILGAPYTQAEPPVHLSPVDLLGGLIGGVGNALSEPAPLKVQRVCSHELGACWESHGLNEHNADQVQDACWGIVKNCPKICRDEYFSRRKADMSAGMADPLFQGRRGEDTSCVPGVDELTHPAGKVKVNDSAVRVAVTVGGQPAETEVYAIPVDAQGNEKERTTSSPVYSKSSSHRPSEPLGPLMLYLPAGRYRLRISSRDRFYHPNQTFLPYQAFPEQVELVSVKTGQTLDKVYPFGMGRLFVNALDEDSQPVPVTLEIARPDKPSYRQPIPLDTRLLAGKYRLVVRETKSRREKPFDIEIRDGKLTTKTVTFGIGSM